MMNGNAIMSDDMTLEEKLAAIDEALKQKAVEENKTYAGMAPVDPQDSLNCEGCQ
jgi:hypothetical protein